MKRAAFAPLLILSLAAACGATTGSSSVASSSPAASTRAASPSTSVSSAAPSSSGTGTSSTTDSCTLVTKADAETAVGTVSDTPVQTAATLPALAERGSVCAYRGANGLLTIGLATKATTRSDFDSIARQVPGVQPVSGIGDAAYATSLGSGSANGATLLVLKGSTYLSLSATSSSTANDALLDKLKTIAQKAVTKL